VNVSEHDDIVQLQRVHECGVFPRAVVKRFDGRPAFGITVIAIRGRIPRVTILRPSFTSAEA